MSPSFTGFMLGVVVAMAWQSRVASAADSPEAEANHRAQAFIIEHETKIRPLEIAVAKAWWNANTSGKDEDFAAKEEAQNELDRALSDAKQFAELKAIGEAKPSDQLLARQIEVLYLGYLEKQVPPELLRQITAKANAVEKAFNVYRAKVGDRQMTDSAVRKVLSESKDSSERKAVWEASKAVGPIVEADLKELVALRNEVARRLGFKNYHAMQLYINEQSQEDVLRLFDELDQLTRGPFEASKAKIDEKLAADYRIPIDELRPWHYHDPFFQEAPTVFGTNLDAVFEKLPQEGIVRLCEKFYTGIDLPIDDVIERSDLYERRGKSPHAFCTDIDREGDVRVLANIVPNEYWMSTMLHELGHAVYSSKNIPASMPYVLRTDAHILATEGVAMMFERFAKSGDWLVAMGVEVPDVKAYNEAGARMRRDQLLIFSRWCQVMLRFEKGLYEDPTQDLNGLWWDLVEKYQGLHRPEGRNAPDYASKIHIVSAPAYYHNYMLGQLFACQVHRTIAREVLHAENWPSAFYVENSAVGRFMTEKVFAPGRSLSWNELTRHATGEPLSAQAFAEEFAEKESKP
ncbi:MAG TPA: M2 family metallopeptidase [Lacipirellulaceae bacterium]|nr:M2 family metallopeptidase [Lacipirellulaceae bacterium]